MAILRPVYPAEPVYCETCFWHGLLGDCDLQLDEIVRCPCCGWPVTVDLPEPDSIVLGSLDAFVLMTIRCRHCGSEFRVTKDKFDPSAPCPTCGK